MDLFLSPVVYAFLAAFFVGTGDFLSRFSSSRRAAYLYRYMGYGYGSNFTLGNDAISRTSIS